MSASLFPHFRQRFIHESVWAKDTASRQQSGPLDNSKEPVVKMAGRGVGLKGEQAGAVGYPEKACPAGP